MSDKKRKRDSSATVSAEKISVISAEPIDFPPVIVSTLGVALPLLPFKPFTRPPTFDSSKKKRARPEYLLHGTNSRLDYEGREAQEDFEYHQYYIGVFDPETNAVELHIAPKVHVTSAIKAHRQRDLEVQEKGTEFTYAESKVALGKAFGTRKAQSALTSREINKIDVTDMEQSVSNAIVSQVEENTRDMPTTADLGRSIQESRPLPKYNDAATKADEVYKREDIITEEEWESIWVSDWVKNGVVNTKSTHVNKRAMALLQDSTKKHTRELKILKYVSSLIDFFLFQQRSRGRMQPLSKAKNAFFGTNPVIIEGFFNKFTETTSGQITKDDAGKVKDGDKSTVSPKLEQKILYYLAVLCLMVDQYDVDIFDLKHDLNILPRELAQAFKEVGCSIKELSKIQYTTMKMNKAEAIQHKRAVLKIPLEFPPPPRKRTAAGSRR